MAEQFFDTYSDSLPPPADDPGSGKNPHTGRYVSGQQATSRRRPSARKREKRAEVAAAAKARREREELHLLETQGFTPDEAARLIRVEDPNEAVMRRLRFQRWLVEHGLLDEFSA